MDMSRLEGQRRGLHDFIVPSVRQHTGFVSGSWLLDREAGQSVAVITFTSREAAESLRENVKSNAANQTTAGVELIDIRLLEVQASA
jgi:Asp/Glu/hydantoin racemase